MSKSKVKFIIISIVVIVVSILLAKLLAQKPKVEAKPEVVVKTPVRADKIQLGNYTPHIKALAKVEAANQVDIKAEVTGKIIKVSKSFVPGGFLKKGEVILEIDVANYKVAYAQAKADYATAKAKYNQALGTQSQAQEELKLYEKNSGKKVKNTYLALRKPELEQALADLNKAKSALDLAQINLDRTVIKAPFNAIVFSRDVSYGGYASPDQKLATLVDTDSYWVNASIPVSDLSAIDFTNQKTKVTLTMSNKRGERAASIFKLQNYLGASARFVGLLLVVPDPLLVKAKNNVDKPTLLLGDYVNVDIEGKQLSNLFRVPLYTIRRDNTVWLYDAGKLKVVTINKVFEDNDYAYITGLNDGDLVINTDLSIVSPGMLVKLSNDKVAD